MGEKGGKGKREKKIRGGGKEEKSGDGKKRDWGKRVGRKRVGRRGK